MALDQTARRVSARKSPVTATRSGIDWKCWTKSSCFLSVLKKRSIRFLGIESAPTFVPDPEGNSAGPRSGSRRS